MNVIQQTISPTKLKLIIKAEASELEPIRRHVLSHFKNVKVPGFRAGKAPSHLIEQSVGQRAMADEFMEHAMNELYRQAVELKNLRPVATEDVKLKKFVPYSLLEFEAVAEVIGPISLPDYKTFKISKKSITISNQEVDEVINSIKQRLANRVEVSRAAKLGDELIIDFYGRNPDGQAVAGADGRDYPLILGSKSFIPGFEENLTGTKPNDAKQFYVTFPDNYPAVGLRSKKIRFEVQIKKVHQLKIPLTDDALAAKAGPFKTIIELKSDIRKQLKAEKVRQAEIDQQNTLINQIADKTKVEIPRRLVQQEIISLEDQEKQNLGARGQTWHEHLNSEGITEEQHRQRNESEALQRVKTGLILSEIANKESIIVTEQELDLRLHLLRNQYQDSQMQAELDKPENRQDIEARLLSEKTLARLMSYASK